MDKKSVKLRDCVYTHRDSNTSEAKEAADCFMKV